MFVYFLEEGGGKGSDVGGSSVLTNDLRLVRVAALRHATLPMVQAWRSAVLSCLGHDVVGEFGRVGVTLGEVSLA